MSIVIRPTDHTEHVSRTAALYSLLFVPVIRPNTFLNLCGLGSELTKFARWLLTMGVTL